MPAHIHEDGSVLVESASGQMLMVEEDENGNIKISTWDSNGVRIENLVAAQVCSNPICRSQPHLRTVDLAAYKKSLAT